MSKPVFKKYAELTKQDLYDLIKLRIDVFVVEQCCAYPELDEWDQHPDTLHSLLHLDSKLIGYCRILPKGSRFAETSLGRIVIEPTFRKSNTPQNNYGEILIMSAIDFCQRDRSISTIVISAQAALKTYYENFGFTTSSQPYLEDNIPHLYMTRRLGVS